MYLHTVCATIKESKKLTGEELYKLNEAVFNLNADEKIDKALAIKVYQCATKCVQMYNTKDENYAYDLRALLGTLQNQHFFTAEQNANLVQWLYEAFDDSDWKETPKQTQKEKENAKKQAAELEKLRKDNAKLEQTIFTMQSVWNKQNEMAKKEGKGGKKDKKADPKAGSKGKGKGGGKEEQPEKKKRNRNRNRSRNAEKDGEGKGGEKASPKGDGKQQKWRKVTNEETKSNKSGNSQAKKEGNNTAGGGEASPKSAKSG